MFKRKRNFVSLGIIFWLVVALLDSSPVIGIAVEYDALRGTPPFHGCQHNMQGPTGIGAAIALAKTLEKNNIPGSVWVFGTPAEEVGPPAKAAMAKAGYFEGTDFMFRSHGTSRSTARMPGGVSARHVLPGQRWISITMENTIPELPSEYSMTSCFNTVSNTTGSTSLKGKFRLILSPELRRKAKEEHAKWLELYNK